MDPVAAITGEHYDPDKEESFVVTGARGSGGMSSPLAPGTIAEAIGAALGNPACQSTVVGAVNTVVAVGQTVGQALQRADDSIQGAVDSLRK